MDKVQHGDDNSPPVFTHGLHHLRHLSSVSPVRYMMYCEAAAAFISLHQDNTVQFYQPDGRRQASTDQDDSMSMPFMGLTSTKLPDGRLVGWGPGPVLTLLDGKLRRLASALEPLDVRVCQAMGHHSSTEVVTAGAGNVCVWAVMTHTMQCKVKILEGVSRSVFTQMALAPPRHNRPRRAFAVCGRVMTVVDLDAGHVLEHKKNLCSRDITSVVHCSQPDRLIVASKDLSIKVWGPYWELCMAFTGHQGLVTSMLYCSKMAMLLSASQDRAVRCWDISEAGVEEVQCVRTGGEDPPSYIGGGPAAGKRGSVIFSYSGHGGVDFWTLSRVYTLHCKLGGGGDVRRIPLRQILVPPCHAVPYYPSRALCVIGDGDVVLVAAETGAVLSSFSAAAERVVSAAYCVHREVLLVLTEAGAVLQADALTNPVTLMDEWRGRGTGPWWGDDKTPGPGPGPGPGPASCLALYSHVADAHTALQEWRSLQEERGHSHRNVAALLQHDAKNKFLVVLGQTGGCISVLELNNGRLLHRTPAHNGQRVTGMQADPENSHLLTIGEDQTVLIWMVCPYSEECLLSLHRSLYCGQSVLHVAVLGPRLALVSQDPHNATSHSLMQYSLLSQSLTTDHHPAGQGHMGYHIGLCVCPEFGVFASASADGTVRIWNQENHLIRTLQLSAQPECIAYSGDGDLLLGIRGDLYRISCATFLPPDYHIKFLCTLTSEPVPDITMSSKHRAKTEENGTNFRGIARDSLQNAGLWSQDYEALLSRNKDLASLLQGTVQCKGRKPSSTPKTHKEAFDRYMKMIYGTPPKIKIEDRKALLFRPKPRQEQPCSAPILVKGFFSEPKVAKSVDSETKKNQRNQQKPAPGQCKTSGSQPNSIVVGAEQTIPKEPYRLKDHLGWDAVESKEEKRAKFKVVGYPDNMESLVSLLVEEEVELHPPRRVVMTLQNPSQRTPLKALSPRTPPNTLSTTSAETLSPRMPPNSRTTTPPPSPPTPPQTSTPEIPGFLEQFAEEGWFKDIYSDHRCIPCMPTPEDLSVYLLGCLNHCTDTSKLKILAALQTLHSQRPLQNLDDVFKGLIDSVYKCVRPNMDLEERTLISETLKLLVSLKPDSHDLTMTLLSLLAYKDLSLQKTVLSLLKELGVEGAEEWLWPELESWKSETRPEHPDTWKSLRDRADNWLEFWTTKYKEHSRCITPQTNAENPLTGVMVDLLNYFCSVQKEEPLKPQYVPPKGRKDAVLFQTSNYCSQPVHRLGENYCMARTRRPGRILPPVSNRPFLMGSTNVITLPLPRISLLPFSIHLQYPKAIPQRHFILKSSYVEYYR